MPEYCSAASASSTRSGPTGNPASRRRRPKCMTFSARRPGRAAGALIRSRLDRGARQRAGAVERPQLVGGRDLAVLDVRFVILLDLVEVVDVIDHEAGRAAHAL